MVLSKSICRLTFILLSAILVGTCQQRDEAIQVILCIGQSNMAGRAEIPPEDTITLERVYLFNDQDKWERAKNPLNRYSTILKHMSRQKLGPSWTFSKSLSDKYPNRKFGLVINARGGTSIDLWRKGSHYYNEAVIRALKAQREGGQFIGIIWHQGEADRNRSEGYFDKFADMVLHLRRDLGSPDLPVIIGEIGNWKENSKAINEVIASIPYKVPQVASISVDGLAHMGDSIHFDTEAQHILGKMYAEKLIELVDAK